MSRRLATLILAALATLILAACGSDGGSSATGSTPVTGGVTSGIAVDPYIVGAVFEEISADGRILQPASTPSDDQGQFTFPRALTPGSTVRLKISQRGTHVSAPFEGMLKRKVLPEDVGQIVVSPMTTLVANGMNETEVAKLLTDAGFQVDKNQIYSNPMLGLDNVKGQVPDSRLEKLRANMALNAFMVATGNFDMGPAEANSAANFEVLQDMGQAVKGMLNSGEFTSLAAQLATDPTLTEPLHLNDLVHSTVDQVQNLVQKTRSHMQGNGGHFDRAQFASDLNLMKGQLQQVVRNYVQKRQDANSNMPPVDGRTVFTDNCSMCHNIGNGGTMDLTGKGTKAQAKISGGHNNRHLTADELTALTGYLDNPGGATPPGNGSGNNGGNMPADGTTLYANNCAGCHGGLDTSSKAGRGAAAIQAAIDNNTGGMNFLSSLTATEVQSIADALAGNSNGSGNGGGNNGGSMPADGTTLYGANCAGCHGDLANTVKPGRTSTQIQAAIDSNTGGMGYLSNLTMQEVQAIADALPAAPPVDPTLPPDGIALYNNECAGCHGNLANTSKPGRTAADIQGAIDTNRGGMGYLGNLTTAEIQAIADALPAPPAPTPGPVDGAALYGSNCAGCHGNLANTGKPGRTATDIQNAIDGNTGGMGFLATLSATEVQAIADALPTPPTPTPGPVDGAALYGSNCAGCHGNLAGTSKPGRTATDIQNAIDGNTGGMGFLATLSTTEVQAIADALPAPPAPTPGPVDGAALYGSNCAGCHGSLASTSKPGRTATDIQNAIDGNTGGMGFLATLSATEVQAIADALPASPAPTPGPVDGAALYSSNCAGCHGSLASTSKPGRTATDIQNAIDGNTGGMGFLATLSATEVQAIADALPAGNAGGGGSDYSDCTACHGQPPNGSTAPNTAGAHAAHKALPGVGTDCSVCHTGRDHNGQVDLGFPAAYDSKNATATDNQNGQCSNISCHGGKTTPDWWSGSIAVNSQCTSCHASGTGEYNSYNSGKHSKHIREGFACTVCHNTAKMDNHFGDLTTPAFETSPAATIGGGSTRVGSYANGKCSSIQCHGSESWNGDDD
ncbi:c-type cytochrome [Geothermobacter hydrogeniphilus]|uniref:Cytochrome c domain-containing protein n=1 Tax=Geothermobacter hydrogeniphilus TaxID=1969733 RepID=A0A1X0YEE6_9BACT|nr:CxxxxCH/CxxCH domain-containing protein [Geothermobacter hydrogeniphilus]ORJ63354.1 hypothetical protein B5V00_00375 [Geothermobacter hydrogeniphilus]